MGTNNYTAVVKQDGDWWIGWIEELPGVNSQESTREELLKSLRITFNEALEFNRGDARRMGRIEFRRGSSLHEWARNSIVKVVRLILLMSLVTSGVFAQGWRGIVPLHSTRAEVLKLMGKPSRSDYIYDLDEGTVRFMYARARCERGLPSDWGNWNVPADTVINIDVEADIALADLKVENIEQYKWYTDDSGATYYRLKKEGLEYQVHDRRVTGITYGPRASDASLMCVKNPSEIRY
jgi:predicted RNase H-like HicB family nuclease